MPVLKFYYIDRTSFDESPHHPPTDRILLDSRFRSNRSVDEILTEAFSDLNIDPEQSSFACELNFEHFDEFVLRNESYDEKKMKMILCHLDDYESRLSVANSQRAYERCMRKLDMGMGEEKDDDPEPKPFDASYYHPYGCECDECKDVKREIDEMEKDSVLEEEIPKDTLIRWRFEQMQLDRIERLRKKRAARKKRMRKQRKTTQRGAFE